MIQEFLEKIKRELGIEYTEHHFETPPAMPYITYERPQSNNFYADGIVYFSSGEVDILLHESKRDEALEKKIESALNAFSMPWEKDSEWDEEEDMFIITYSTEEGRR